MCNNLAFHFISGLAQDNDKAMATGSALPSKWWFSIGLYYASHQGPSGKTLIPAEEFVWTEVAQLYVVVTTQ